MTSDPPHHGSRQNPHRQRDPHDDRHHGARIRRHGPYALPLAALPVSELTLPSRARTVTTPSEAQFYDSLAPDLKRKVDQNRAMKAEAEARATQLQEINVSEGGSAWWRAGS